MPNSFGTLSTLSVGGKPYSIHRLAAVEAAIPQAKKLPFSLKILLENLLRNENGLSVGLADGQPVLVAQQVFEEDLEGEGELLGLGDGGFDGGEAVDRVGFAADGEGGQGSETVRHRGTHGDTELVASLWVLLECGQPTATARRVAATRSPRSGARPARPRSPPRTPARGQLRLLLAVAVELLDGVLVVAG